jgi:threonine synthase
MARLMAALHDGGDPTTVLVATSGDTGGAVAHAFYQVPHMRVVVLYPAGRVSPTQEAQLTMFNGVEGSNVRAFAVDGSFDDCQSLVKAAFADEDYLCRVRLTSANSINIGRLLPQMVYYFQAVADLGRQRPEVVRRVVATPSGNFGNLTAGLMAKRLGLPIARFVAATNVNDVVPEYLATGLFEARPSIPTIANAMDVGNPSNFERMLWLYGRSVEAMRQDIAGSRHTDGEVKATIRRVWEERGYLLDPHGAIGYLGITQYQDRAGRDEGSGRAGIFLATAHPAKFGEIVEPIIGEPIEKPRALVHGFVRDLYRIEIRRLRERLLKNEFPRKDYASRVIELRRKYPLTSLRPWEWLE